MGSRDCPERPDQFAVQPGPNSMQVATKTSVERKKWQNRLRQRAWRQRKKAASCNASGSSGDTPGWQGYGMLVATDPPEAHTIEEAAIYPISSYATEQHAYQRQLINSSRGAAKINEPRHKLIPPLLSYAVHSAPTQSSTTMVFPLPVDHTLLTLVQYNVLRAVLFNMSILSILDRLPGQCALALQVPSFGVVAPEKIPFDLQPTALQQALDHPYWIDAIPFPRMRDNLILSYGKYDAHDFCCDLGQGLYEGFDDVERRGCLVWTDPWSAHGWEVSEGFVKKWGLLLQGCSDLIASTNQWRDLRGDEPLVLEV